MIAITKSVGQKAVNIYYDVKTIQQLINLNLHLQSLRFLKPLVEDGICGQNTITAIREFQQKVMQMKNPDCIVMPKGPTFLALIKTARKVRPANVTAFLAKVVPDARKVKLKYGVPIAVLIAQAALESGWGQHVKDNAYFGIKGKSQKGKSTSFNTTEYINGIKISTNDTFRAYTNFKEAAEDYGLFLTTNPRYQSCFSSKGNPLAFADKLQAAGYATDPQYATKLKRIIQTYYLEDYDR